MSSITRSASETIAVTALDIREVFSQITLEVTVISRLAGVPKDCDLGTALIDASLLALNDIVDAIRLQFYSPAKELIREHTYRVSGERLIAEGPPPDQPPTSGLDCLPPGTRVRLVVSKKQSVSMEIWEDWLRRLGWKTAEPLQIPPDLRRERYGSLISGGYGVTREVAYNPKYDRPIEFGDSFSAGKGDCL